MTITESTYYGFSKLRGASPETQDWSTTDHNWELVSKLLKAFEGHQHTGAAAISYPGEGWLRTISFTATGGTFTLTFNGQTTSAIDYNATAATVQTALENLSNVASGEVVVEKQSQGNYTVILKHTLSSSGTLTGTGTSLTGGSTTITVTTGPALFKLSERTDLDGVLAPGTSVGVRLSYITAAGLETNSTQEVTLLLSSNAAKPLPPEFDDLTASGGVPGGTYLYGITKVKGSGETVLSDGVLVDVPFDDSYDVNLIIDSIQSYADGTTAINIYRSTGLTSAYQKVGVVTNTTATTFTDTNTVAPENVNVQPPSVSTYDAERSVRINWGDLTHPDDAETLKVYVTSDAGIWGTNNLLAEVDLTAATPATYIDYLGTETLVSGWPKEASQVYAASPKINLATEATGGLALTATSNFAGHAVSNFKVGGAPTVTKANGMIWYDSNSLYARVNGADVVVGTVSGTLDWANHPTEAAGGHIADNIPFVGSSAVSVKDVLDTIVNSTTGARKQVHVVTAPSIGSETTRNSTSYGTLLTASSLTREFADQWVEVFFSCDLKSPAAISSTGAIDKSTVSFQLAVGGTQQTNTQRSLTSNISEEATTFACSWMIQLTSASSTSVELQWKTDGQTWTAMSDRRQLYVKQVY